MANCVWKSRSSKLHKSRFRCSLFSSANDVAEVSCRNRCVASSRAGSRFYPASCQLRRRCRVNSGHANLHPVVELDGRADSQDGLRHELFDVVSFTIARNDHSFVSAVDLQVSDLSMRAGVHCVHQRGVSGFCSCSARGDRFFKRRICRDHFVPSAVEWCPSIALNRGGDHGLLIACRTVMKRCCALRPPIRSTKGDVSNRSEFRRIESPSLSGTFLATAGESSGRQDLRCAACRTGVQ